MVPGGLADELKKKIEEAASTNSNVAAAVNSGEEKSHTSVTSKKRVIQKDRATSVTEEREERRA